MKYNDLFHIYNALKYNNPKKRAFINSLKNLHPNRAKEITSPKPYDPYYEDPLFAEAKILGISKSLVLEAARWIIKEDEWKRFDIKKL